MLQQFLKYPLLSLLMWLLVGGFSFSLHGSLHRAAHDMISPSRSDVRKDRGRGRGRSRVKVRMIEGRQERERERELKTGAHLLLSVLEVSYCHFCCICYWSYRPNLIQWEGTTKGRSLGITGGHFRGCLSHYYTVVLYPRGCSRVIKYADFSAKILMWTTLWKP